MVYWDQSALLLDQVAVPAGDFNYNYEFISQAYKNGVPHPTPP
jgi:hypothetical protein